MFSGNAAGTLLPPYVVYKASHMWSNCTENGPRNCRYDSSAGLSKRGAQLRTLWQAPLSYCAEQKKKDQRFGMLT